MWLKPVTHQTVCNCRIESLSPKPPSRNFIPIDWPLVFPVSSVLSTTEGTRVEACMSERASERTNERTTGTITHMELDSAAKTCW